MKKLLAVIFAIGVLAVLFAPDENNQSTQSDASKTNITSEKPKIAEPTSEEMNELTLTYIQLNQGTINCKKEVIGNHAFAACQVVSLNGNSAPQIWYYNSQKDPNKRFYAFTGNARTVYDKYFTTKEMLGDYAITFGLPIPKDMDMSKITQAFNEKMK